MASKSTRTQKEDTQIAVMANDLKYVVKNVDEIKATLKTNYVTTDQFTPVRNLVYGLVGLILTGVGGAIMALIFK